jgi:hypothetical protein
MWAVSTTRDEDEDEGRGRWRIRHDEPWTFPAKRYTGRTMKLGTLFAWSVPELRKLTGAQLLNVWGACTPFSRPKIYLHLILLMACCSLIFNLAMRVRGPTLVEFFVSTLGLAFGLTVPSNVYFYNVFNSRRAALRRFIEEHWEEFNK